MFCKMGCGQRQKRNSWERSQASSREVWPHPTRPRRQAWQVPKFRRQDRACDAADLCLGAIRLVRGGRRHSVVSFGGSGVVALARAQDSEHRALSTGYGAQSTEHRA